MLNIAHIAVLSLAAALAGTAAAAEPLDVLHWWTSTSERAAVQVLVEGLRQRGHAWAEDGTISGGDDGTRRVAAERTRAGRHPDAMLLQSLPTEVQPGRYLPLLPDSSPSAGTPWQRQVPDDIARHARQGPTWVAAPLNVHRTNMVWADRRSFERLGLKAPASFAEFIAVAQRLRAAGQTPLAHGREPWQDTLLFDNAVLSVGGAAYYRAALVQRDARALDSPLLDQAFEQLVQLRDLIDPDARGRPWNFSTAMVLNHRAAMQVMGDWVGGEAHAATQGSKAGNDAGPGGPLLCFPYPGTQGTFVYVVDMLAFPSAGAARVAAQQALADTVMAPEVQLEFSRRKGSIPARADVPVDSLSACARNAAAEFQTARRRSTLVHRFTSGTTTELRNVIGNTLSAFFDSRQSAREGAAAYRRAIAAWKAAGSR